MWGTIGVRLQEPSIRSYYHGNVIANCCKFSFLLELDSDTRLCRCSLTVGLLVLHEEAGTFGGDVTGSVVPLREAHHRVGLPFSRFYRLCSIYNYKGRPLYQKSENDNLIINNYLQESFTKKS